ncbi:hypothetical protein QYE76_036734 [Lolium multiflorum]|uniref:CCHC-type domain-containing protein n=1 Tax=Lolium multiflorum TaxID=4521 RepID=A0AAD8R320_LOLMU|nr:hypothetical protein QYE76_036734 [Lolium multiflorum]
MVARGVWSPGGTSAGTLAGGSGLPSRPARSWPRGLLRVAAPGRYYRPDLSNGWIPCGGEVVDCQLNATALYMIQQAVSEDDRPYIEKATTANDAWDILVEVFLGSSSMRQNKFQEVSNKAEGFYMEDGEHHRDMYRRLKALAISFRDLGATYVDDDWIKRKYINALLSFEPADLRILKNKHNFEKMTSNDVMQEMDAFKVESKIAVDSRVRAIGMKRSENLVLKAHVSVEDDEDLMETKYEGHSEELKRDLHGHIALLTKSFWRDPSKYKLKGKQRVDAKGLRVRNCYNCGKQDHFIAECPYENREDHGGKLIPKDKSKVPRKNPFVKKSGYDITKKPSKYVLSRSMAGPRGRGRGRGRAGQGRSCWFYAACTLALACGKETAGQVRDIWWPVDVLFDGQGYMYLDTGFDKFARDHNLKVGCLLHFLYEGDGDMSIRVFDDSS